MCNLDKAAEDTADRRHLSVIICGHVNAGKSTTTGRLLFELGGIASREMSKLKEKAAEMKRKDMAFAFYLDRSREERERGITIQCTTKHFYTAKWHYTIIDAPGHRDFIKNMISGAAQADVALLLVPVNNSETALQKYSKKPPKFQGQTRAHARLLNLLGVKQVSLLINKMDVAGDGEEAFRAVSGEARRMLIQTGWKKDFIDGSIPIIPVAGRRGDNLISKSCTMPWWKGVDVQSITGEMVHVHTVLDFFNDFCDLPERKLLAPVRVPISGVYKIKGVGDIVTGRVEQGVLKPGDDVLFLPSHTLLTKCQAKIKKLEMHHTNVDHAHPGDNVGINIKGWKKNTKSPHVGDVLVADGDTSLQVTKQFTALIQTLETIPNEIKSGYSPIGFVRCGHSACKITKIHWKIGKDTGGKKSEDPSSLKSNEMAEITLEPAKPLMVDTFTACEGLSRIAFLEGNCAVMLGKITKLKQE